MMTANWIEGCLLVLVVASTARSAPVAKSLSLEGELEGAM